METVNFMLLKKIFLPAILLIFCFGISNGLYANDFSSFIEQGKNYYQAGNLDEATNEFKNAIKVNPNSANAHFYLGYVFAEKFRKSHSEASMKHLADQMSGKAEKPPLNIPTEELNKIYEKYGLLLDFKDKSIEEFTRALELNPDLYMARYFIAVNHLNNKRFVEAAKEYQKAIKSNPTHVISHGGLGAAYKAMGKYDLAIASYEESIKLDGDISMANLDLAEIYLKTNQREKAEEILKEMKEKNHILYDSLFMLIKQYEK